MESMESSRLFVKNLPPTITEADFRKHFATGGREVTDVKLIPKRRIGYVGYKTSEEAAKAVKYFNRSYIRMARINVELARPISSDPIPPSTRRVAHVQNKLPTPEPEPKAKASEADTKKRKREEVDESDPKFKEFLEVMKPGQTSSSKLEGIRGQPTEEDTVMAVVPVDAESDDEYESIPAKKPKRPTEEAVEAPLAHVETPALMADPPQATEQQIPPPPPPATTTTTEVPDATDDDWLRSRTSRLLDLVDPDDPAAFAPAAASTQQPAAKNESLPPPPPPPADVDMDRASPEPPHEASVVLPDEDNVTEQIRRTGRLFVRNLPFKVTEDELRKHFGRYGETEEVSHIFFTPIPSTPYVMNPR